MSDTPKTDAEEERMKDAGCSGVITVSFVRQLECELAEAKTNFAAERERAEMFREQREKAVEKYQAAVKQMHEAASQRDRLAEAMTEMWAFIEEDYFPNCVTQSFESAVQKYNTALAAVKGETP